MLRGHGFHRHGADLDHLVDPQLFDRSLDAAAQERAGAARDDDSLRPAQAAEGAEVEVVVVDVGDEHRVEVLETAEVERLGAAEHDDALAEQRVGEETDAVQLDENRRVSDPA